MRSRLATLQACAITLLAILGFHFPFLRLPYFWDEAGYYIPAALDFRHAWQLVPTHTMPVGHTPLVIVYLGFLWRLFGYSPLVTRIAMAVIAAATVATLYTLARQVASRETALWSALLLALSPLFFAQSTLVHLDLAAALFTTLAILFLLRGQLWPFALGASAAVLSKETAVVLLPVAWLYIGRLRRGDTTGRRTNAAAAEHSSALASLGGSTHSLIPPRGTLEQSFARQQPPPRVFSAFRVGIALAAPLVVLAAWALYYHRATGYWTGNREYLSYNLYSNLSLGRVFWTLLRRSYELFLSGFNWLLTASAVIGFWWSRKHRGAFRDAQSATWQLLAFLTAGLVTVYLVLLSVVGGAVLPRYLLPVWPAFYLFMVGLVNRLPRWPARLVLTVTAACFVWAWFINPHYPFPFEDNLAYTDFIRLHQQAARYLEMQAGHARILTAWPATDELTRHWLGYVDKSLGVVPVQGFAPQDFAEVEPEAFDILYLYSRKWEPPDNWVARFPKWLRWQERYFDYRPQIPAQDLAARFHLRPLAQFERRGQWVWLYGH